MTNRKSLGYISAIGSAILWGISGTFAQFLFQRRGVDAEWLVTVRLLIAGTILLVVAKTVRKKDIFQIWQKKADAISVLSFGIFGMLAVQYTYFAAIRDSNAATATVLQYLGPVVIAAYYAWVSKRIPKPLEIFALALAVLGTFFLVTHGHVSELAITPAALFWGIGSAVALASYSIQPVSLLKRFDSAVVVGWGMFAGGVVLSFVHPPWKTQGVWDVSAVLSAGFIVIFGSFIAFYAYLTSIQLIGAGTASLLACAEPLSAALVAVVWLGTRFGPADWLGTFLIVGTIMILSLREIQTANT